MESGDDDQGERTGVAGGAGTLWRLIGLSATAVVAGVVATGVTLSFGEGSGIVMMPVSVCVLVAWIYRYLRPAPRLSRAAEDAAQMLLILLAFELMSYPAAILGGAFAYRDAWLAAADRALGLDWHAYLALVDGRPMLNGLMKGGYESGIVVLGLIPCAFAVTGQRRQMQRFLMALWLSGAATLAIFMFMPALHAFAYYGIGITDLHGLHPVLLENRFVAQFTALRAPGPHRIPMGELEGLVEFPSFHTTMSFLFVWALWPLRWLRPPVVVASLLSLSSTPIDGAHFFVDMIAGAVIAAVAIVVATRWARGRAIRPG